MAESVCSLCRTALFFPGDPGPKTTPLCNPNPIIISSNCQVYLCKAPCSCHHAQIFPACTLQTDPAGSFYYRVAGSVLSRIFQHLQFRKISVHQNPLPLPYAFTCTPSGSDRFLHEEPKSVRPSASHAGSVARSTAAPCKASEVPWGRSAASK